MLVSIQWRSSKTSTRGRRLAVHLFDAKILAELIDEGQERDRLAKGDTAPLDPGRRCSGRGQGLAKLQYQPRFTDARFPGDADHLAPPSLDLAEAVEQGGELALAANERGEATLDGHVEAGPAAARP